MVVTKGARMMSATSGHNGSDPDVGQAPGDLASLQAFVNTLDIEQGTDELATPSALGAWLRGAGLTEPATQDADGSGPAGRGYRRSSSEPARSEPADRASPADLELAVALREALRAVLRSHVTHRTTRTSRTAGGAGIEGVPGMAAPPADLVSDATALARIAQSLSARITADDSGAVRVLPGDSGSRAGLARLLLIAAEAATRGTWDRLKVCSADDCQWAFYDRSPTRSGCWCSMQVCGSRAKSRAYRSRQSRAS
jgi:predicted RNA-binding Zn ribbon-like protein